MERKLATIQKILTLNPIEGADKIEQATIKGWNLIVGKDEFKVGDLVVLCEIDSVLPDKPEFEFMRPRKFRVKTIKLKGVISQGLALPLSLLPEGDYVEGQEVTELLGITKYEAPIPACLAGIMKGSFPGFIQRTDEERIQNIPHILEYYSNKGPFIYTEKIDGTSATFYIYKGEFGVCSRNIDLQQPEEEHPDKILNVYWKVAKTLGIEAKMRNFGDNFALQGEIIGEVIQDNKYNLKGYKLFIFDLFDIATQQYVAPNKLVDICQHFNLQTVPAITTTKTLPPTVDELVEFSQIKSTVNTNIPAEGLVVRPKSLIIDHRLGRLSFKVINPEFLLHFGE